MINVFTNGCFDIIHPGHIHLLKTAKSLGNTLTVGINSDWAVKRLKGKNRPINTDLCRANVLRSIFYIDSVFIFDDVSPMKLIKRLRPNILVVGDDYSKEQIIGKDFVLSYGGEIVRVKKLPEYSTTNIINKILEGK